MQQEDNQAGQEAVGVHPALVRAFEHEWLNNDRTIVPLIDYNLAYLVVAQSAGHLPSKPAGALVGCLTELRKAGLAAIPYRADRDGLQPNLEAEITARIGAEAGGWLSIGRARQECELVARQIVERDQTVDLLEGVGSMVGVLAMLARREVDAIMPYHTWMQHAEPITFGYFAAATAHALAADCARLEQAFRRLDTARAGAGQVVPPPFQIDREEIARLLGFDGVLPNSLHAYSSLDIEIELLSAIAIFGAHLARLAETLFVWAAPEFGFLRLGAEFTGTSYAMPQKQNPYALRLARPLSGRAIGALNDAMHLFSGSLPIVGNGIIHIPNRVIALLGEVIDLCSLLAAALPTLELDRRRMRDTASSGWAEAPQLVFYLVEQHGVSFRQAHEVCAQVVRSALEQGLVAKAIPHTMVEEILAKTTGQDISISEAEMHAALDADAIVATRSNGGPAPQSVQRDADDLEQIAEALHSRVEAKRAVLAAAARRLQERATALI